MKILNNTFLYKARKSLFSCVLLTLSIGFCYAFSIFAPHVIDHLNASKISVQFAFCLNIFFLGSGASMFGALVEKNIKRAAWLSTFLLFAGLMLSGIAMNVKSIQLFYVGFGVCCGLAEGIGYVVPVKNLLLFFGKSRNKALITAISIIAFGLGSSLCSFLFKWIYPIFKTEYMFFAYAVIYLIMTSCASLMIDKPKYAKLKIRKLQNKAYSAMKYVKDSAFIQHWLFMFLNISMGLVIIGQCAGMLTQSGMSTDAMLLTMMLCGIANGAGRLVFPAISDYLECRMNILCIATVMEISALVMAMLFPVMLPVSFILINMGYGCFFACLPALLSDCYGNAELSFLHGITLSSWGIASLFAFIVSAFALSAFQLSSVALCGILIAVYALNFINIYVLKHKTRSK